MHTEAWQELLEILDSEERFLPLTGVRITPALATGDAEFDFVAVNKARIDYLGQPPPSTPCGHPWYEAGCLPSSPSDVMPHLMRHPGGVEVCAGVQGTDGIRLSKTVHELVKDH
jgi:hypothetical protein